MNFGGLYFYIIQYKLLFVRSVELPNVALYNSGKILNKILWSHISKILLWITSFIFNHLSHPYIFFLNWDIVQFKKQPFVTEVECGGYRQTLLSRSTSLQKEAILYLICSWSSDILSKETSLNCCRQYLIELYYLPGSQCYS